MNALYLVKERERLVALAAERDGQLYCYVPNLDAFVYNKPMSIDFLIEQTMTYEQQSVEAAAGIDDAGIVGMIDGHTNKYLLDCVKAEPRRLTLAQVLGASTLVDPTKA